MWEPVIQRIKNVEKGEKRQNVEKKKKTRKQAVTKREVKRKQRRSNVFAVGSLRTANSVFLQLSKSVFENNNTAWLEAQDQCNTKFN